MEKTLRFVWFWTFWHWSREGRRAGKLAGDPLTAIADNWGEWFNGLASAEDLSAIEDIGRNRGAQSQFVGWLFRNWARETTYASGRSVPRFAVSQLARVAPFSNWAALTKFRDGYGLAGVPAIILTEQSSGKASDVRAVEALVLPSQILARRGEVIPEGFKANAPELQLPASLARNLLSGKASHALLLLWVLAGRRCHGHVATTALQLSWLAAFSLLAWLVFGPDPVDHLPVLEAVLLALWGALVSVGAWTAFAEARNYWRGGKDCSRRLEEGETHLRANMGLTVEGGSAGLAFALNIILASYRSGPVMTPKSWIWRRVFQSLDRDAHRWAATGVVTSGGWINPVVLPPKLRACFQHGSVTHILTPAQRAAASSAVEKVRETIGPVSPERRLKTRALDVPHYGFASDPQHLQVRPCRHVAQALMSVSTLFSRRQIVVNVVAFVLTTAVFTAAPDLRSTLLPSPPPSVTSPASPSPYYLWVTIDSPRAENFGVVLESRYWTYRRAEVVSYGGPDASNRAVIRLLRFSHTRSSNPEDGVVWIERRRKLLWREYAPGDRVGQYSLSYLNRLGRE